MTWRRRFHPQRGAVPIIAAESFRPTVAGERDRHERPCLACQQECRQRRGVTNGSPKWCTSCGRTCIISGRPWNVRCFRSQVRRDALGEYGLVERGILKADRKRQCGTGRLPFRNRRRPGSSQSATQEDAKRDVASQSQGDSGVEQLVETVRCVIEAAVKWLALSLRDPSSASRGRLAGSPKALSRRAISRCFAKSKRGAGMLAEPQERVERLQIHSGRRLTRFVEARSRWNANREERSSRATGGRNRCSSRWKTAASTSRPPP